MKEVDETNHESLRCHMVLFRTSSLNTFRYLVRSPHEDLRGVWKGPFLASHRNLPTDD